MKRRLAGYFSRVYKAQSQYLYQIELFLFPRLLLRSKFQLLNYFLLRFLNLFRMQVQSFKTENGKSYYLTSQKTNII